MVHGKRFCNLFLFVFACHFSPRKFPGVNLLAKNSKEKNERAHFVSCPQLVAPIFYTFRRRWLDWDYPTHGYQIVLDNANWSEKRQRDRVRKFILLVRYYYTAHAENTNIPNITGGRRSSFMGERTQTAFINSHYRFNGNSSLVPYNNRIR